MFIFRAVETAEDISKCLFLGQRKPLWIYHGVYFRAAETAEDITRCLFLGQCKPLRIYHGVYL